MTQHMHTTVPLQLAAIAAALCLLGSTQACAQLAGQQPGELEGVGIVEHLNAAIPLGTEFRDEDDRPVKLEQYFGKDRPVILTMNYSNCPMLCSLQLNALVDGGDYYRVRKLAGGLKGLEWSPGKQFEVITVSIDPLETPKVATMTKQRYINELGRPQAAQGWHFLTGRKEDIQAVADAVGFQFRWDEQAKQYLHDAATMILTPDGHVSRYLYGIEYDPQTLKMALLEASEGKIGNTVDRVLLYCFHYDAARGRYAPAAMQIMRLGGVATVLILGLALSVFWLRENRRKRLRKTGPQT
jgi:protein SCO1/2